MATKSNNKPSALAKLNEIKLEDLNNIDWNNMGSWPVLGKLCFCLLLFSIVLGIGYVYLIDEQLSTLEQAQVEEQSLKKIFESKSFQAANLDAYRQQMAEMNDTFGELLQQLPRDTEVPGLLDDISAAAVNAGLKLNSLDPQKITQTEFYSELPFKITVEGGYHEMGAFVSAVASLPRIVTLHDYDISRFGKEEGQLKMNILAKTYQYNGEQGAKK